MKNSKLYVVIFLMLSMAFVGYQCGSTEITSARLYIQQKNWDKAIEVLQKEITKNPKSDEGFYLMGYVNGEKGNYNEMVQNYDKSLALSKNFEKNIQDSRKYFWAQSFNKGVGLYQRGVKTTNNDSAQVFFDKSITEFKSAIMIEPDSGDTYKNLAFVYLSKGDNDAAIDPLKKLIEKEKALDGYKFLGEIYYVNGTNLKNQGEDAKAKEEFNKGIAVLEEGLKVYPNNSDLLLTLSNAYIGADRTNEAIDPFKKGVEADPQNKYYRYNYGVLLLGIEDFAGAEEQFKKAVEIDPDYDNAIYNLGVTYLKWGTYLNKKADEEGKVSDEYKDKYQLALPYLEKAVQMKDATAQTWELLGRVYSVLGMQDDAANAFKKADELR
ncbi:MAG: tetratricopeptide repeat protein [Ignavibacteriaceae bacterium]|jgi:tetratricopeptide (TPR) repeat protein|nr:tetratricopeptide repeat protein [Ignavibacteriaceae bacterium]